MNPLSFFRYPAYIYNPRQALRRLCREFTTDRENDIVRLPWGHKLRINSSDFIGRAIAAQGIHEIDVCEAIARVVKSGDIAVDVGANIGFMTSLMSRAVGNEGCVFAFEPHPDLYSQLEANVARFADCSCGRVITNCVALSDCEGERELVFDPKLFARNSGTAGLLNTSFAREGEHIKVTSLKLDRFIAGKEVGLLKVDVEGAELCVLRGAESALTERRIKAVVYEDFNAASSGIVSFLRRFGFSVFHLDGSILRPHLRAVDDGFTQIPRGRDENFVAVLDREELIAAYRRWGWRVFRL